MQCRKVCQLTISSHGQTAVHIWNQTWPVTPSDVCSSNASLQWHGVRLVPIPNSHFAISALYTHSKSHSRSHYSSSVPAWVPPSNPQVSKLIPGLQIMQLIWFFYWDFFLPKNMFATLLIHWILIFGERGPIFCGLIPLVDDANSGIGIPVGGLPRDGRFIQCRT